MAKEDVNIKVDANTAEAVMLWKAMAEGPEAMAKALDGLGNRGKAAGEKMEAGLDRIAGKWVSIQAAINLATQVFNNWVEANRKAHEDSVGATMNLRESELRFFAQSGMADPARQQAASQLIQKIAFQRATQTPEAFSAATQLVSSGAAVGDVLEGGGLDAMLQIVNASNAQGQDTAGLSKSLMKFLSANKLQANRENIMRAGGSAQGLFLGTNLQISGLDYLSPVAGTLAGAGLSPEEQLAAYSQLLYSTSESQAATMLRSGVVSLRTAASTPEAAKALKRLGVDPTQVDFSGEGFADVQKTMAAAFARAGSVESANASKQIFGKENLLFSDVFLNQGGIDQFGNMRGIANQGPAGVASTLAISERGPLRELQRAQIRQEQARADDDSLRMEQLRSVTEGVLRERGYSPYTLQGAETSIGWTEKFGFGTETAIRGLRVPGDVKQEIRERMQLDVHVTLEDPTGVTLPAHIELEQLNQQYRELSE